MAENTYEGLFILDSNKYAQNQTAVSGKIDQIIEKSGGKIKVSRFWDERRLAYPINKHRKGTYWLVYFELDSQALVKLNREFTLCEEVIRSLVLKIHPKLVDAIVGHATSESASPSSSDKTTSDEAKTKEAKNTEAKTEEAKNTEEKNSSDGNDQPAEEVSDLETSETE